VGEWLAELGSLRREILQREPANEARRELLHQLASRDLCGFEGCPTRALARRHAQTNLLPAAENGDSHSAIKSTIERKP
jgi:precorrin-2 dehydrogenase/sirohydrochlorin ferrochelatase